MSEVAILCPYCRNTLVRDIVTDLLPYKPQIHLWALEAFDPDLAVFTRGQSRLGKFLVLNKLLSYAGSADYYLLVDDDVKLPVSFLPKFLEIVLSLGAEIAQPALTRNSHYSIPLTLKVDGVQARLTNFIESGPLTFMTKNVIKKITPFPSENSMGWGLDVYWSFLAMQQNLPMAIVDACAVEHSFRPVGLGYSKAHARSDMRRFLKRRGISWPSPVNLAILTD
jgi:hypothetical protein